MATAFVSAHMGNWQERGIRFGGRLLTETQAREAVYLALPIVSAKTREEASRFLRRRGELSQEAIDELASKVSGLIL